MQTKARLLLPAACALLATLTFSTGVLAGSPVYVAAAQINTLDMGLAFFSSGAIFALASGFPLLFWACCALAVLPCSVPSDRRRCRNYATPGPR